MIIRLYWWQEKRDSRLENYGDLLSKYLVEKISGKWVVSVKHPSIGWYRHFFNHYLVIGSIISAANKRSIVWGSGIIKKNDNIRNANFVAVRGPKTRERILEAGFNCPEVYGDPGLLLPDYYNPEINKKYKIGIVPHYVDYEAVDKSLSNQKNVKVINLLTNDVEKTTDEILECEFIFSSSLHGLVIAHTYGIPALWVKFSNKLSGDDIKFYDYFESLNIAFKEECKLIPEELSIEKLELLLKEKKQILLPKESILKYRKEELLNCCPFT